MQRELSLFVGTFTTLLAIINPLEVLPVYLQLLLGKDAATHRAVARKACVYALLLSFFFLVFGTLMLRIFGVPLSMVRVVGGIILMKIGFELFTPDKGGGVAGADAADPDANIAFVPLAMPLMFGPGAIATIIGMTATIRQSSEEMLSFVAICSGDRSDHARYLRLPRLRRPADEMAGADGDRRDHPHRRLLRLGDRGRTHLRRRDRGA